MNVAILPVPSAGVVSKTCAEVAPNWRRTTAVSRRHVRRRAALDIPTPAGA
jgi:hypothetical protein